MFRGIIDSFILKELNVELRNIVAKAKSNASWSKEIPSAISSIPATTDGQGRYEAKIIVNLKKDGGAPMAAAFEYGSGIHSKTNPDTYRIPNIPNEGVAFPIERWPKYHGPPRKYFYFSFVNHPGVAAKPFLQPAIESRSFYLSRALAKALGVGILDTIKTEWNSK